MKNCNQLSDFSFLVIRELIDLSTRLALNSEPRALAGKVLSFLFLNRSLRKLASCQATMARLGSVTFVISPKMSIYGLESYSGIIMDGEAAEHIHEAVPDIACYSDAIEIRAFAKSINLEDDLAETEFNELVSLSEKQYINMQSAIRHSRQSLADWKTLNELEIPGDGGKFVSSWAWHPEPLPLAVHASTLQFATMRGMDVTMLRPGGYQLPQVIRDNSRTLAAEHGGRETDTDDKQGTKGDAHVIYAYSWSSGQFYSNQSADDKLKQDLRHWCIDEPWFNNPAQDCRFMHCLPVRRGVTVSNLILDCSRGVVIDEPSNRMLVQMAVLHRMLSYRKGHSKNHFSISTNLCCENFSF